MSGRPSSDFPFCSGWPVAIDGVGWSVILGSLVVGFLALVGLPFHNFPLTFVPAILFAAIPLAALHVVTGPHWLALFGPVRLGGIAQMLLFGWGAFAGSLLVGFLLMGEVAMTANPLSSRIATLSSGELILTLLPTIPQLLGEELLGILPFLAAIWLCLARLRMTRRVGIIIGLAVSALIFGAAHLPTYDWNWAQALVGIGSARILLTLAYIVTRNIWISTGAHIVNDWTGFLLIFATGDPIADAPV